jgi:hypothetical protein
MGYDVDLAEFDGVGHTMSPEMNALFHVWLDRAVCVAMDDGWCRDVATMEEEVLRGLRNEMPDAGPRDAGEPDAGLDAGIDAGRRRRRDR